jgi:small-conductance mechanosensitive channel
MHNCVFAVTMYVQLHTERMNLICTSIYLWIYMYIYIYMFLSLAYDQQRYGSAGAVQRVPQRRLPDPESPTMYA